MSIVDDHCQTCKYWHCVEEGVLGECCRNPPVIVDAAVFSKVRKDGTAWVSFEQIQDATHFPVTDPDSVCGEYVRNRKR